MPSFDVVSEVNMNEVTNALDQANKEITNRFDLKNSGSKCRQEDNIITVVSDSEFHLEQVVQVLMLKLAKRKVDLKSILHGEPVESGKEVRQQLTIQQGIEADICRKIIKTVKNTKSKTQASIQGDKVRVSGKKRDDLQSVISLLKENEFGLPLQFSNFRD